MTEELDDGARDFIARALREEGRADPAQLVRIRGRVLASALTLSGAGGAAQAAGLAGKTWLVLASTPLAKIVLAGSLVVGGAATLAVSLPERGARRAPRTNSSARAVPVPSATHPGADALAREPSLPALASAEPGPAPAALATAPLAKISDPSNAAPPSGTPGASPAASPSLPLPSPASASPRRPALGEELAVLQAAQARLNAGDGKGALHLLDETAMALGDGQLAVERRAVEILAACKAGELQRADRLARQFLAAHPDAPAAARVRGSCAGEGR